MKIIPKYQTGGTTHFVSFDINQGRGSSKAQKITEPSGRSSKSSDKSEKSESKKLTEKDFFDMLKNINALPNERRAIISNLKELFTDDEEYLSNLDSFDIRLLYLNALDSIAQSKYNSDTFGKVTEQLSVNDAYHDPAITPDGKVVVVNQAGNLGYITPDEFLENNSEYQIVSNYDLAHMRENSGLFVNDTRSFGILHNAVSTKKFQEYIDAAKITLQNTKNSFEGQFSIQNGKALQGIELLSNLQQNDKIKALGSVTADGLYEYKIIDENGKEQIDALTSYIVATMPQNIKTWAQLKTGLDKNALKTLVETYLISGSSPSHSFEIDYKGSMKKVMGGSSNSSSGGEDPKMGFWAQVQADTVGENSHFFISPDNTYQSTDGKYLGSTPGLDKDKSLQSYLSDSELGNLRINKETITFGDVIISEENFKDLVVLSSSGAYNAILPANPDGTVNLKLTKLYSEIVNKLKQSGLEKGSSEYNKKQKELLDGYPELSSLFKYDGSLNESRFRQYIILEGIANSNTLGKTNTTRGYVSMDDIESDFIIDRDDDENLQTITENALNTKDSSYEIDDFQFWKPGDWKSSWYTHFYTGMIYIPISPNRNSASLADKNVQKESTVYDYEAGYQNLIKLNNLNDTTSK